MSRTSPPGDGRTAPVVRRGRMGVMLTSSVQHREDRGKHARIVRVRVYGGNVPDGQARKHPSRCDGRHSPCRNLRGLAGLNQPKNSKRMRINGAKGECSQDVPTQDQRE